MSLLGVDIYSKQCVFFLPFWGILVVLFLLGGEVMHSKRLLENAEDRATLFLELHYSVHGIPNRAAPSDFQQKSVVECVAASKCDFWCADSAKQCVVCV
jgi:hypothetical protein